MISSRLANFEDSMEILLWRNDPVTRKSFFNNSLILIFKPCCIIYKEPCSFKLSCHICQFKLNPLIWWNWLILIFLILAMRMILPSNSVDLWRMCDRGRPIGITMNEQKTLDIYMDYIRAFENKDYHSIADLCRTPFFASSPSGTASSG